MSSGSFSGLFASVSTCGASLSGSLGAGAPASGSGGAGFSAVSLPAFLFSDDEEALSSGSLRSPSLSSIFSFCCSVPVFEA